jgi:hypothetical protein
MKQKYRYGTTKYISFRKRFRAHLNVLLVFLAFALIAACILAYDIYSKNQTPPTPVSNTTVKTINFDNQYFSTPYFRFTDSGNWQFIKSQSTGAKFVFQKFLPNSDLVQHQLMVYINFTPPPLELAASRVLPVNLNSDANSFKPSQVSDHCGKSYKQGELHKVETRRLDGTTLLCDPEQGQFRVVLAKAGGDYNFKLKRSNGEVANYIIIYQNQKIDPDTDTVMQIANSFQAT